MPSTSSSRLSKATPVVEGTGGRHHAEAAAVVATEEVLVGATRWLSPFPTTWLASSLVAEVP